MKQGQQGSTGLSAAPYLLLPVKPTVHHWVIGAQGGSRHLSLELGGPGTRIPRKTPVGVASPAL